MKRYQYLGLLILSFCFLLIIGCQPGNEVKLTEDQVIRYSAVGALGEEMKAIIIELDAPVSGTIDKSAFAVYAEHLSDDEPLELEQVYLSALKEPGYPDSDGQFVILEFKSDSERYSTLSFNLFQFIHSRDRINYSIQLLEPIELSNQTIVVEMTERIQSGKIVTETVDAFSAFTYEDEAGNQMPYRLYIPEETEKPKPLVLFLHGSGERGSDNLMPLIGNESAIVFAEKEQQAEHPAYVLVPQSPFQAELTAYWLETDQDQLLRALLDEVMDSHAIDPDRVYVTGISNGGTGAWHLALTEPERFAAVVPVSGVANPRGTTLDLGFTPHESNAYLTPLIDKPIWVFHAADDPLVNVNHSREAVAGLKDLGSAIKYTEYPAGEVQPNGHFAWINVYQTEEMLDWLFQQVKE